jgi:signal transduction histidine kinase
MTTQLLSHRKNPTQSPAARPKRQASPAGATPIGRGFDPRLRGFRIPVRLKITLPYVFLAGMFALAGAYVLSQVVFDSFEERFTNQLIEAGTLTADRMVVEEQQRLESLRLIAYTTGFAEALAAGNPEQLRELVLPVAVNNGEQALVIFNQSGQSVLTLRQQGANMENYLSSTGTDYSQWDFVQAVLQGQADARGNKFAGVIQEADATYFYVTGPILDSDGNRLGGLMVGRELTAMARNFRQDTLAHTNFYDLEGRLVATSLLEIEAFGSDRTALTLSPDQISLFQSADVASSLRRPLNSGSTVDYSEIVDYWRARDGKILGLVGSALPRSFLVQPRNDTQVGIFSLILAGLALVITIGWYLSRRITRPLLQIVSASTRVADGDLSVKVKPVGNDEVAVLAHAFNYMTDGLQEATERRLREIELVKALQHERELRDLKSKFVSMVSHEFRTPLATILSSTEFIKAYGKANPDKQQKHFDRIQSSVGNMTRLLEDVLLIGKTEANRLEFNPAPMQIDTFCKEIADEIQSSASEKHVIIFRSQGEPTTVIADARLLRLLVNNLLSNAVKYSPKGGQVVFTLVCEANRFLMRVKDSGIGIPEQDQARLFETFQRASNVSTISGTGLGLYITRMVVELHSGSISFKSAEGSGTTFTVILPTNPEPT